MTSPLAHRPNEHELFAQPGGLLSHPSALATAWASLTTDTGAVVFIADGRGTILWHNEVLATRCRGAATEVTYRAPAADEEPLEITPITSAGPDGYSSACRGRCEPAETLVLSDVFPKAVADERIEMIRRCIETSQDVTLRGMVWGELRQTRFRPLPAPDGGPPTAALCVCVTVLHADQTDDHAARARCEDRGVLEQLTDRELEVLTLISRGLTTQQVADHLSRSVKTVEWHRLSLGNKLGVSNRVELAQIAIRAGLVSV